jgi:hypothetical protein
MTRKRSAKVKKPFNIVLAVALLFTGFIACEPNNGGSANDLAKLQQTVDAQAAKIKVQEEAAKIKAPGDKRILVENNKCVVYVSNGFVTVQDLDYTLDSVNFSGCFNGTIWEFECLRDASWGCRTFQTDTKVPCSK